MRQLGVSHRKLKTMDRSRSLEEVVCERFQLGSDSLKIGVPKRGRI